MAVKLSPLFNEATLDSSGNPWTGAQLFTYTAGSSTKQTTYQDSGSVTPHTNPIILNSRGEPPAEIWLTSGISYKFVLTSPTDSDPPVSPTRTMDNVSGVNDTTVTQDQWVSGPAPTFVSTTSFTLVGDQTTAFHVGRRVKTTNSGGTIYSIISVSAFGALTTVTVVNDSGVLDSGLSAVSYGLLASTNPSTPLLVDTYPLASGSADKTKKFRIELDGLTTATTRVGTPPDEDFTFVGVATAQTLTNKTLTAPTLNGALAGDAIAAQAEMETGTSTDAIVSPGRQHFHPGHPKCWAYVTVSGGAPTLQTNYNITSITDTAQGQLTITIATDFSTANWSSNVSWKTSTLFTAGGSGNFAMGNINTKAAGSILIDFWGVVGTGLTVSLQDPDEWNFAGYGDQA